MGDSRATAAVIEYAKAQGGTLRCHHIHRDPSDTHRLNVAAYALLSRLDDDPRRSADREPLRVLESLGSAGQGDVYRVRDTYENAIGVLKLLNVVTLTAGTWDEAQILRDLADDHILEIRNADLYAGQPYIVTALAEHGTL
jgi:serine/threonine protein kinase